MEEPLKPPVWTENDPWVYCDACKSTHQCDALDSTCRCGAQGTMRQVPKPSQMKPTVTREEVIAYEDSSENAEERAIGLRILCEKLLTERDEAIKKANEAVGRILHSTGAFEGGRMNPCVRCLCQKIIRKRAGFQKEFFILQCENCGFNVTGKTWEEAERLWNGFAVWSLVDISKLIQAPQ